MSDATIDEDSVGLTLFSGVAAVVTFAVLTCVTVLLFEQLAVGVVVGALSGVGTFLTVPYTFYRQNPEYARDAHQNLERSFHSGAAGYALAGSGVVALALLFVFDAARIPVAVALTLAMVEYVVLSRVLPRADESAGEDDEDAWSSDDYDA